MLNIIKKRGENNMKFYAVKKGKKTGIFESWEECEEQVKGFSGAEYKKFGRKDMAEEYMNESEEN
jgi:ribonuclease HI